MKFLTVFVIVAVIVAPCLLLGSNAVGANADHYNSGLLAMKTGNFQEAIDFFTKAIQEKPDDYRFYNDRGVAHKRLGNLESALSDYNKALELKPDYTNALNNRGVIYLQQGKYDEALLDFNEALKFGGIEGKIYTNMGIARASKGDHRSALRDFDVAVSFRPLDYRSFLFMGESLEEIGDREKALKMYQVAMGLIREPDVVSQLEKKILSLEKLISDSTGNLSKKVEQTNSQETKSKGADKNKKTYTALPTSKREIVLATPSSTPRAVPDDSESQAVAPTIENIKEIEKSGLASALKSFSNPAREIFKQGLDFIEKSDPHKALIRFEDARQLEKRNRNALAVAWCQLYLCRLYSSMGENIKAIDNCDQSLKIFSGLKAYDELALALIESGNIKKASGFEEQARATYAKAIQTATSAGRRIVKNESKTSHLANEDVSKKTTQEEKAPSASKTHLENQKPTVLALNTEKINQGQKKIDHKDEKPVPSGSQQIKKSESNQKQPASLDKMDSIGRGPVSWGTQTKPQTQKESVKTSSVAEVSARSKTVESQLGPDQLLPQDSNKGIKNSSSIMRDTPSMGVEAVAAVKMKDSEFFGKQEKLTKPEHSRSEQRASKKSIEDDLNELRRLRKAGNEKQMIVVLEKLAEKYSKTDQYEKALNVLNISVAFREKIAFRQNEEITFNQRGLINEKLGNAAQALEDYTRALSTLNTGNKETEKILESKSRSLAGKIGLDVEPAMENFKILWLARSTSNTSDESMAFYNLAKMYSKAQKFTDSLNYFDRSSAALMTEKAKVLEKLGRFEQAQKEIDLALETFKKLDYSQYLNILRKSKNADHVSRN
ncbi:MAG: tetratricopeptide repeat protein [Desulfomonilaceae bacterium]